MIRKKSFCIIKGFKEAKMDGRYANFGCGCCLGIIIGLAISAIIITGVF